MIRYFDIKFSLKSIVKKAVKATLSYFDINEKSVEAEIGFLSEEEIKELNLKSRNVDRVTDVLSFPSEEITIPLNLADYKGVNPETGALMLGEIYICLEKAKSQAVEYGHGLKRELAFLTVHGMLHLLGFDHIAEDEEKIMKAHAESILSSADFNRI